MAWTPPWERPFAQAQRAAAVLRVAEARRAASVQCVAEVQHVAEVQCAAAVRRVAEARRVASVQCVAEVQHVASVQCAAAVRRVAEAQRVAQERRAIEAQPSAKFLPLAWIPSYPQQAQRAFPQPSAFPQPASSGDRQWPWSIKSCHPGPPPRVAHRMSGPASLPLSHRSLQSCECNVLPTASQRISKFIARTVPRATE